MDLLSQIHSSADVKKLDRNQLEPLCAELRSAILTAASKNGGHLASSLGAVELTVALHRVYDTSRDRIVFDVGHQCYAHKMLTGRLEQFDTLRRFGGLSGFPKPCESADDACISGHASNSISIALGMAKARTLTGADYGVAAVIGDGALTGGLAYEGLANCGASGESIVIILNDNGMSINSNVGAVSRLLARQRVRPSYLAVKRLYHKTIGRFVGVHALIHGVKEWIKDIVLPDTIFEDMGFYYLGPIDGHDIKTLTRVIRYARELRIPVLVHVTTTKGKGYAPAEANPQSYHGVSPFDPAQGVSLSHVSSFSEVFGEELSRLASQDGRIVAITAAMADGTGLSWFSGRYPERFFDVGIAEEHAAAMAAGMAAQGLRPVFAVYSSFLQRSYDMLVHDIGLGRVPVVLAVDRAGLVGADGETHQGSFDLGLLRQTPGMTIYAPSNYAELRSMLRLALDAKGPAAVRYPRGSEGKHTLDTSALAETVLRDGTDLTIVTHGIMINEALAAADELESLGLSTNLIKLNRLDADEFPVTAQSVKKTGRIIVLEEVCAHGCMGQALLAYLAESCVFVRFARLLNLGDGVVTHGEVKTLRRVCGIDSASVVSAAKLAMEETNEESKA